MNLRSYAFVLAALAAASGVLWTQGQGGAQQRSPRHREFGPRVRRAFRRPTSAVGVAAGAAACTPRRPSRGP